MKRFWSLVLIAAPILATSGCVARPRVRNPGPEGVQQARAQRFDPYPQNYAGLPSVAGTRPLDYREPRAEVLSVQPRKGEPIYGAAPAGPAIQP